MNSYLILRSTSCCIFWGFHKRNTTIVVVNGGYKHPPAARAPIGSGSYPLYRIVGASRERPYLHRCLSLRFCALGTSSSGRERKTSDTLPALSSRERAPQETQPETARDFRKEVRLIHSGTFCYVCSSRLNSVDTSFPTKKPSLGPVPLYPGLLTQRPVLL